VRSVVVLHDKGTGKKFIRWCTPDGRTKACRRSPQFQETQVKDIAAYLLSLVQANANRNDYEILNIVTGDAGKGETYFKAHCATCIRQLEDLAHIAASFDPRGITVAILVSQDRSVCGRA